jgi:signal transduction histidine kinase
VALACAGVGGWLLWRSNRTLGALVEARTARIAAVDASRRLFFAKASHELRTPVAGLRSAAEVALEAAGDDTTMLREALHQAVAGATFLSHRIDELLGLAGADEGQLVLAQARFDLAQCVGEALAEAKAYARSVEVELALVLPDDAASGLPMTGDARWLRQALLAVIENGLKFAPMHSVLVVAVERIGMRGRPSA